EIELTDGSKIQWSFTEKSENLSYITKEGIKQTTGVIKTIGERYFGHHFDIDSFLNKSPKQQQKELQKVIGIDLDEIDARYKEAYSERTEKNRELKRICSLKLNEPEKVEKPNIGELKKEISEAREENEKRNEAFREKER